MGVSTRVARIPVVGVRVHVVVVIGSRVTVPVHTMTMVRSRVGVVIDSVTVVWRRVRVTRQVASCKSDGISATSVIQRVVTSSTCTDNKAVTKVRSAVAAITQNISIRNR